MESSGSDWSREGPYVSRETILRALQGTEQLNDTLACVLELLQRLTYTIPTPDRLPVVPASHNSGQMQACQETIVLAVQNWTTSVHDRETYDHTLRVMWLAEATARQLAQSETEIRWLCLAAVLHDIGKVCIPAIILYKPGPLTQEEWSIIRCHPDIGRQILEQAGGIFHQVASIVGMHHERWDGHGYPRGTATNDIPLNARILAVVDSYDAMTSQRVYQQNPRSVTQACIELQRCAGSQFDPWVVKGFLLMLEKYPALALKSSKDTYQTVERMEHA